MIKRYDEEVELAERNRDIGMQTAVDHADREQPKWSDLAYKYLKMYLRDNPVGEFLAEDVRKWVGDELPEPPSNRAWGAVIKRAADNGLIRFLKYAPTKNPRAHRTPASVWEKV